MSCFDERFQILLSSGQANEQTIAATCLVVEIIEDFYGIHLNEEIGSMFVTHLAITLKRLLAGEAFSTVPDEIKIQMLDFPQEYRLAESIAARLEDTLGIQLNESERVFMTVHLAKIKTDIDSL